MAVESPSKVTLETVARAVDALLKWKDAKSKTENPQLLPRDEFIFLVLSLKKIPPKGRTNAYKIPLPTPIHSTDSELCLIIDDRSKSNLTKEDAQNKVKSDDIGVSKLLKVSKLKTDYRPHEAKRKLCNSYDLFLADNRVIPIMPKLLGRHFYKKMKIPVPVDLRHKNWKEQIEKVRSSAMLYLRTGTCSILRVARGSMDKEEIVRNVVAAIDGAVEIVPKKWGNVRSLHLKFAESLALPVYQALPDVKFRIDGFEEEKEKAVAEAGKVSKKGTSGKIDEKAGKKVSKKGRISEVRYMDNKVDDLMEGGELVSADDVDTSEEEEEMVQTDEKSVDKMESKKRKKGDSKMVGVLSEPKGKKGSKKSKIDGKGDNVQQTKDGAGEKPDSKSKKMKKVSGNVKNSEIKTKGNKKKDLTA